MNLLNVFKQGQVELALYQKERKEIYAFIEDMVTVLGYKSKKGIEKLIERNPHLKEKEYSTLLSAPYAVGGEDTTRKRGQRKEYVTRAFTRLGIYEIVSLCKTKQAREIRKALFNYIEKLERQLRLATIKHLSSRNTQNALHEAIADSSIYCDWDKSKLQKMLINFNKMLNKIASNGRTTKKNELTASEIESLKKLERKAMVLLDEGKEYKEIKAILSINHNHLLNSLKKAI